VGGHQDEAALCAHRLSFEHPAGAATGTANEAEGRGPWKMRGPPSGTFNIALRYATLPHHMGGARAVMAHNAALCSLDPPRFPLRGGGVIARHSKALFAFLCRAVRTGFYVTRAAGAHRLVPPPPNGTTALHVPTALAWRDVACLQAT